MSKPNVEIYVDGAGVKGLGGWGALLLYNEHEKELSGSAEETTNNRMELTAPLEALKALKKPSKVTIYSDSEYVVHGMSKWVHGWERAGYLEGKLRPPSKYKKGKSEQLKNYKLWKELLEASRPHDVTWEWVPGHSGVEGNERADKLAVMALAKLRSKAAAEILKNLIRKIAGEVPPSSHLNIKPIFYNNGTFKAVEIIVQAPDLPPFVLALEGNPEKKYIIKIDLSESRGKKKDKARILKALLAFSKEEAKPIKSVKIPKEDIPFWEKLNFKPAKGGQKVKTYIFNPD